MSLISIVVPVYGNADSLALLKTRADAASRSLNDPLEYVFVDDGSKDDSYSVLEKMSREDARVHVVKLSRNFGSNIAILAGLAHSKGEAAVVISADLQDPPELIPQLVELWKKGNKVVLAARKRRDDLFLTRLFADIFNRLFRRLAFKDFPRGGFDFMLIDRQVTKILVELQEKNSYIFGQVLWCGFKRDIVYYDRAKREGGRSGWTLVKKIKYFIDAFTAFSYVPIRMMSGLGFLMAVLGIVYAVAVIVMRMASVYTAPDGWASVIVVVLIVSGCQLILMGILGEYLWRVLDESRRRPLYIVESTSDDLKDRA